MTKLSLSPDENKTKKPAPNRFLANSHYFTIAIYVIIVVAISAVILKAILSFDETVRAFRSVANLLMPFLAGGLVAFVLNPAVQKIYELLSKHTRLKRKGLLKALAIAVTYLIVLSLFLIALFGIVPQIMGSFTDLINALSTSIPQALEDFTAFLSGLQEQFPGLDMTAVEDVVNNTIPSVLTYLRDFAANLVPSIYSISVSIVQLIINFIIIVIVSIYMLTDKKILLNTAKAVIYAFVPVKKIDMTLEIFRECNRIFSGFIIGKAIDSLIIGILCFILMTLLRLPYTMLVSLFVGVTNMIPYFGPFIGAIPGILIMLLVSPLKAVIFGLMVLALQQFDGLILGPKILGDSVGLRPLWIIIAITIGGSVAGVIGMFLGVPIVAVLRYLLTRILNHFLRKRNFPEADKLIF